MLTVELYGTAIGTLRGGPWSFDFFPDDAGLQRFGTNSAALSVAIPLVSTPRRDHASRRRNWFTELLPEGDQYDYMLAQSGLRRGDTPGFLARFGRDVAGALQIWDQDDPSEPPTPMITRLTPAEVRHLLEDPISAPLGNETHRGRTSLGGVQPKILLVQDARGWAQARGGHPTTHLLKPQLPGAHRTVIFDEEFGSRLARRLGLSSFATYVDHFAGLPALVIERYDRHDGARIHQEDFNQALGASGNQKYQQFGGASSLERMAQILIRHTSARDLRQFARLVILTVATGNLDMHAKNVSLLHPDNDDVRLAPAYDVVPQTHFSGDGALALAVNRKYRHSDITRDDLEQEMSRWPLRRARSIIDETLDELDNALEHEHPLDGAFPRLHQDIARFTQNLLEGKAAGE